MSKTGFRLHFAIVMPFKCKKRAAETCSALHNIVKSSLFAGFKEALQKVLHSAFIAGFCQILVTPLVTSAIVNNGSAQKSTQSEDWVLTIHF